MEPIHVETCENKGKGQRTRAYCPNDDERRALFPIDDPFGARKAVVPLFWLAPNGDLQGYGTAFALDPWGCFLTADHVISDMRRDVRPERNSDGGVLVRGPTDAGFVAVLGYGLIFGTVGLPQDAIAPIIGSWSPSLEDNDPLARLQGRPELRPFDIAVLRARLAAPDRVHCLPLRGRPPRPRVGEGVVALGFPRIDTFRGDGEGARTTIEEGMFAAYGRVTQLLPKGRDRANITPVFEVEADWPSGMSGGPVINGSGEVIGLVSRSLAPEAAASTGIGWATWLEALGPLENWVPSLDESNATWRRGWAAIRGEPWHIAGVFPEKTAAEVAAEVNGVGYGVRYGAWRLGTDDFISC